MGESEDDNCLSGLLLVVILTLCLIHKEKKINVFHLDIFGKDLEKIFFFYVWASSSYYSCSRSSKSPAATWNNVSGQKEKPQELLGHDDGRCLSLSSLYPLLPTQSATLCLSVHARACIAALTDSQWVQAEDESRRLYSGSQPNLEQPQPQEQIVNFSCVQPEQWTCNFSSALFFKWVQLTWLVRSCTFHVQSCFWTAHKYIDK